jgi:hypothetical protein
LALSERTLPPSRAFHMLCKSDVLECVGWGQLPRFQLKPSAKRAVARCAPPRD